jgi:hypothetical protein
MKKLITAALLTAALIPATSFAGYFEDGNELLSDCTASKDDNVYYQKSAGCVAYITAISDLHDNSVRLQEREPKFCTPRGVTKGQLEKIVVKYLNENPAYLHRNAAHLVGNALAFAFPPYRKAGNDGVYYCED